MSHPEAPRETSEQRRMREFYARLGVQCGWGMAKDGSYYAEFARNAWKAWQEAARGPNAPDWFPDLATDKAGDVHLP